MKSTRKKAVFFDLDGTLCDTLASLAKSVNDILRKYDAPPIPTKRYQEFVGNGARKLVERAFRAAGLWEEVDQERVMDEYFANFEQVCTYKVEPYPGLRELIDDLKAEGILAVVLTNKRQEMAEKVIAACFPEGSFRLIVGQSPGRPLKPLPGSALSLLWELELRSEDCYLVGDSDIDILTAIHSGIDSIGVLWGFRTEEELRESGADFIVRDVEELRALLLG